LAWAAAAVVLAAFGTTLLWQRNVTPVPGGEAAARAHSVDASGELNVPSRLAEQAAAPRLAAPAAPKARSRTTRVPAGPSRRDAVPGAFVAWPGAAALPTFENGELVRTELPVSVLPLLGLRSADPGPRETVAVDVLVGQDGFARAVRLAGE
jgi:hypothetical protein